MSDAHAAEKKDDKKKDAAAAAPAAGGGMKAMLGPVAAVVVLLGAGTGIGMFISKSLTHAPVDPAKAAEDAHGEPKDGHGDGHGEDKPILTDVAAPLEKITIKTNVTGQGGNRYATATVLLWLDKAIAGHFKEEAMLALIQGKLEEQFKSYSFEELNSPAIHRRCATDFRLVAERVVRSLHKGKHDPKAEEKPLVHEVTITELLVQ